MRSGVSEARTPDTDKTGKRQCFQRNRREFLCFVQQWIASALNAPLKHGQAIEAADPPPDARHRFLHRLRLFADSSNVTCSQKTKVSS